MLKMIIATDDNYAIGNSGGLPWPNIKEDMRYFKEMTEDSVVVMGSNTFRSLQHLGLPYGLSNRLNWVLTSKPECVKSLGVARGNMETFKSSLKFFLEVKKPVWVIGGASVYKQILPFVDEIHWTEVSGSFEADTYFDMSFLLTSGEWGWCRGHNLKEGVAEVSVWKRLK